MKLTLRRDTAGRIVARLLLDASRLELEHRTPVTGEKFTVRPVTIEREIARLKSENAKLQIICDVQKKVSQLLGVTLRTVPDDDEKSGGSS